MPPSWKHTDNSSAVFINGAPYYGDRIVLRLNSANEHCENIDVRGIQKTICVRDQGVSGVVNHEQWAHLILRHHELHHVGSAGEKANRFARALSHIFEPYPLFDVKNRHHVP